MVVTRALWGKLTAVAATGGAALALFGGGAVHTQFSQSSQQKVSVEGANVALTVDNGTFTCSNLLPGDNSQATGCTQTIQLNNTGTVPESFDVTLGTVTIVNGGHDGDVASNLDQLLVTYPTGPSSTTTSSFAQVTGPVHIATLAAGTSLSIPVTLQLAPGRFIGTRYGINASDDPNAWNGASIQIPYTVTASAGQQ